MGIFVIGLNSDDYGLKAGLFTQVAVPFIPEETNFQLRIGNIVTSYSQYYLL